MDTNTKTQQINTFDGGMNTDTSDMILGKNQYRLARNLRYVVGAQSDFGELHQIEGSTWFKDLFGKCLFSTQIRQYGVIAYQKIYDENYIQKYGNLDNFQHKIEKDKPYVYIIRIDKDGTVFLVYGPDDSGELNSDTKYSIVTRYEDTDNIKVYFADGKHYIFSINIMKYNGSNIETISMYPSIKFKRPIFNGLTSGRLKAGLVQYSYSLYAQHGRRTEISPATKLIPIVNKPYESLTSAKQLLGLEKDKYSNSGVQITINVEEKYRKILNKLLIYRIQYIENGQQPIIGIVYDGLINGNTFTFIDDGVELLQKFTLEEYNSISGIHIIPRVIESKDDFLFAANIKDVQYSDDALADIDTRAYQFDPNDLHTHLFDYSSGIIYKGSEQHGNGLTFDQVVNEYKTNPEFKKFDCYNRCNDLSELYNPSTTNINIYDSQKGLYDKFTKDGWYYGGSGANISWKFITTNIVGDGSEGTPDTMYGHYGTAHNTTKFVCNSIIPEQLKIYYIRKDGQLENAGYVDTKEFIDTTYSDTLGLTYANPKVAYSLKSLRRDEVYRYGIILYDKFGHAYPVKWIADIRTPSIYTKGFEPFFCKGHIEDPAPMYDLIVRPLGIQFEVSIKSDQFTQYEIVRCRRGESDIATVSQGVISRPIKKIYNKDYSGDKNSPYTPSGFLTTARFWSGDEQKARYGASSSTDDWHEADNYDNDSVFQFISPEICYHKDSTQTLLDKKQLTINPQIYLFGAIGFQGYEHNKDFMLKGIQSEITGHRTEVVESDTEITDVIHLGITNATLQLSAKRPVNYVIVGNDNNHKLEYDGGLSIENNPMNQLLSLTNIAAHTGRSFWNSRFGLERNWKHAAHITDTNSANSQMVFSVAIPTIEEITNLKSDTEVDGNEIIKSYNTYTKPPKQSFSYIKLYNQSNKVILRGHHKGVPSQDMYYYNDEQYGYPGTHVNSYNKCNIVDYKIAAELGWDDLATATVSNGKTKYSLKYKDSLTPIGPYNFCNWVCGGSYMYGGDQDDIANLRYADNQYLRAGAESHIMGPGGRCLLINIDNNWSINNDKHGNGDEVNYMFADAMCTSVINTQDGPQKAALIPNTGRYTTNNIYQQAIVSNGDGDDLSEVTIYRESIAGTYLCNLRQSVVPYGGFTYQARKLSQYCSYGDIYDIKAQKSICNVFDGDTFILPFEYVSMHKYYNNQVINSITHCIIYSIPVETSINLAYTYGNEFSMHYNEGGITNLQIQPSNVYNIYQQKTPLYSYNSAYSSDSTSRLYSTYNLDQGLDGKHVDYRCMYSGRKDNNETYDSWLKFQPANYIDVDSRYGEITELRVFNNSLVFFQNQATGILSVNERSAITDNSNMPLVLGTGGVLSRYDYFTTKNGMRPDQFADDVSSQALYWVDSDRNEICAYNGGQNYSVLSKEKLVQNYMNQNTNNNHKPVVVFDKQYNEVLFNIYDNENCDDDTLVYNEFTQRFTSTYNLNIDSYYRLSNQLYFIKGARIDKWNVQQSNISRKCFNVQAKPYVKYIINESPEIVKVYDNQYFGGNFMGNDEYTLTFNFNTPLKQNSTIDQKNITNREYDFRFAIPRNNNSEYGDRMRGKTMQCEMLSDDTAGDFSLQYVITKFRMSCS